MPSESPDFYLRPVLNMPNSVFSEKTAVWIVSNRAASCLTVIRQPSDRKSSLIPGATTGIAVNDFSAPQFEAATMGGRGSGRAVESMGVPAARLGGSLALPVARHPFLIHPDFSTKNRSRRCTPRIAFVVSALFSGLLLNQTPLLK